MRSLARWCFDHRRIVLGGWFAAVIVIVFASSAAGSNYSNDFHFPDTDSQRAYTLLKAVSPQQSGDQERLVIAAKGGAKVTDPAVRAAAEQVLADLRRQFPDVADIQSPYDPGAHQAVSPDHTVTFATVTFAKQPQDVKQAEAKRFVKTITGHNNATVEIEGSGFVAQQANQQSGSTSTIIGLLAAAVVLFLAFGSFLAMLLPLISTVFALVAAYGVVTLLTHAIKMPQFSSELMLLIGLGVGIDYALFIVTRHRQGLLAGKSLREAVATSADTSGRAVLFAGITVCIALLGMFALGVDFFYGMAIASSIAVLLTMLAALTLMPALLGFFGSHVLSRRHRRRFEAGERLQDDEAPGWRRWASTLERHPALPAALAGVLVLLLAVPFLSLRLGSSDQGNDPKKNTTRKAYDLLATGFGPGYNGPYQLTAEIKAPGDNAALQRVVAGVEALKPAIVSVTPPRIITGVDGRRVALVQAYPSTAPQDAATGSLLHRIRRTVIPAATAGTALRVYVGGNVALFDDFTHVLASKLPLFVGVVVLLSFLLLTVVFRSLLIPLVAAVMNLLSIGASFGVITAVFQWGWLADLFGVDRVGPIEAFLPVLFFAILFGLSMDYEVFLVSRMHEEWVHSKDNRRAVTHGLAATGKTITAAAAIMIVVFSAFILGGERGIKEAGVGLASAILIDALVIRSVLVPSLMLVIGKANWWLPGWLDRALPSVSVDPSEESIDLRDASLEPEPAGR
jgi:RND superfamily putative drug exporter